METLMVEMSKILNVTVEKATELYPILKSQFINYKIISSVNTPLSVILSFIILMLVLALIFSPIIKSEIYDIMTNDKQIKFKKYLWLIIIIFILGGVLSCVLNGLSYILAPDLMLIKEFI